MFLRSFRQQWHLHQANEGYHYITTKREELFVAIKCPLGQLVDHPYGGNDWKFFSHVQAQLQHISHIMLKKAFPTVDDLQNAVGENQPLSLQCCTIQLHRCMIRVCMGQQDLEWLVIPGFRTKESIRQRQRISPYSAMYSILTGFLLT